MILNIDNIDIQIDNQSVHGIVSITNLGSLFNTMDIRYTDEPIFGKEPDGTRSHHIIKVVKQLKLDNNVVFEWYKSNIDACTTYNIVIEIQSCTSSNVRHFTLQNCILLDYMIDAEVGNCVCEKFTFVPQCITFSNVGTLTCYTNNTVPCNNPIGLKQLIVHYLHQPTFDIITTTFMAALDEIDIQQQATIIGEFDTSFTTCTYNNIPKQLTTVRLHPNITQNILSCMMTGHIIESSHQEKIYRMYIYVCIGVHYIRMFIGFIENSLKQVDTRLDEINKSIDSESNTSDTLYHMSRIYTKRYKAITSTLETFRTCLVDYYVAQSTLETQCIHIDANINYNTTIDWKSEDSCNIQAVQTSVIKCVVSTIPSNQTPLTVFENTLLKRAMLYTYTQNLSILEAHITECKHIVHSLNMVNISSNEICKSTYIKLRNSMQKLFNTLCLFQVLKNILISQNIVIESTSSSENNTISDCVDEE